MIAEWWVRRWNWEMREERGVDGMKVVCARAVAVLWRRSLDVHSMVVDWWGWMDHCVK